MKSSTSSTVKGEKVVRRRLVGRGSGPSNVHLEEYLSKSKACISVWKNLLIFYIAFIAILIFAMAMAMAKFGGGGGGGAIAFIGLILGIGIIYLVIGITSVVRIINTYLCIGGTIELMEDTNIKVALKEGKNILGFMMISIVLHAVPGINFIAFIANWVLKYLYYKNYTKISKY